MARQQRRTALGAGRRFVLALAASVVAALAPAGAAAFEPVSVKGRGATIELTRLGSYRGGIFADESVEVPPAHDAAKQRLYHIDATRDEIVVLDIDEPSFPHKEETIDLGPIGQGAVALAFRSGVLAIAFEGPETSSPGTVAFINRGGRPEAPPVEVGAQPTMLVSAPTARSSWSRAAARPATITARTRRARSASSTGAAAFPARDPTPR